MHSQLHFHVQLDQLVWTPISLIHITQQDPKPQWEKTAKTATRTIILKP